ncbi:hypothetical protein tb265_16030 [Gemmatimonadetes bacterium T265]|nr:hypothetical protein tb265_16030 [Gemmatimonadetes bacterium T265]
MRRRQRNGSPAGRLSAGAGQAAARTDPVRAAAAAGARYAVRAYAGAGTVGDTWHATDLTAERDVALRVIDAPAGDAGLVLAAVRRLQTAAVAADHPGIVAPLAVEPGAGDAVLVATPYIEGGSLADVLAAPDPLPFDAVVALLRDVAAVLAHAHARGLAHGGVAPTNIFADADGRARLTDFGVAGVAALLPAARGRAFLRAYTAPEQWRGHPAEPASDQYALAVVAYELLSGAPHRAPDVEGVATVAPIEVSVFTPVRPGVGLGVNAALRTALAASPVNRFPTVAAFVDALGAGAGRPARGRSRLAAPLPYVGAGGAVVAALGAAAVVLVRPAPAPIVARPAAGAPATTRAAAAPARAPAVAHPAVAHPAGVPARRARPASGFLSVSATEGAPLVVVDGRSWGAAPAVVATTPGAHRVEVRGPGMHYRPARLTVHTKAGDTTAVAFWREP